MVVKPRLRNSSGVEGGNHKITSFTREYSLAAIYK